MVIKNKRGWIKIIEAFIAVLLVVGVLLIFVNKGYIGKKDISEKVYQAQLAVLREIELNDNLRQEILNADIKKNPNEVPKEVVDKINQRMPDYLNCTSKICDLGSICVLDTYLNKEIYSQAVAIATEGSNSEMRQLKMFCWTD